MTATHFEAVLGNPLLLSYTLDRDGVPTDPDTLRLRVASPETGSLTIDDWSGVDGVIVRDSAGRFHAEVVPDGIGPWAYRWEALDGSSNPIGAAEGEFIVHTVMR